MRQGAKHIGLVVITLCLVFFLSGCTWLRHLDDRAGEIFFSSTPTPSRLGEKAEEILPDLHAEDLTKEMKAKVDEWLAENKLNRYGDVLDTMYTGGTPLFNELTGESIDRFDYILKKHPDILNKIGK